MDSSGESMMNTITVPTAGDPSPAILGTATNVPMRLVVNNIGGTLVILSHTSTQLSQQPALAGTFQLLVGQSNTFVLAPKQSLFAVGQGAGAQVSVAASLALSNRGWGS